MGVIVLAVMKLSEIQGQSKVGMQGATDLMKAMASIDGVIKEPLSCAKNFAGKMIDSEVTIDTLVTSSGDELFKVGDTFFSGAYKISEIKLGYLDSLTGRVSVIIKFQLTKDAQAIDNLTKTVFIYPTLDGKRVVDCLKNANDRAEGMLKQICYNMDPSGEGKCDYQDLLIEAKREFCNSKPWLSFNEGSGTCGFLDQGKNCGSLVAYGYTADGQLKCKNPFGTTAVEDDEEDVTADCEPEWNPKKIEYCKDVSFTQIEKCSGDTRNASGTKNDASCDKPETCSPSWTPALSSVCKDVTFEQNDGCDNTRSAVGTSTTGECKDKTGFYRIDCGGVIVEGQNYESGERCNSPHGNSCKASELGKSFGTATCYRQSEEYGQPTAGDGQTSTESCTCIDCTKDSTQQKYLSDPVRFSRFACE